MISTQFPHHLKLTSILCLGLFCLAVSSCSAVQGVYPEPQDALDGLQRAVREDSRMNFLGTLSLPTLREYEHAILIGWPEVREAWGFLAETSRVVSVEPAVPITRSQAPSDSDPVWVWPEDESQAVRATLAFRVDGRELTENVLLVREEVRGEGTASDRHVRVGDRYVLRERHPNTRRLPPQEEQPVYSWRLLVPYQPYQQGGELVRLMAAAESRE